MIGDVVLVMGRRRTRYEINELDDDYFVN